MPLDDGTVTTPTALAMIRAPIPLGMKAVEEALLAEVTALAGPRYQRQEVSGAAAAGPNIVSFADRVESELQPWRTATMLFGICGVLALVTAAIGIAGFVGYEAHVRGREMAVRAALGATPSRVIAAFLLPLVRLVALGVLAGVALSFASRSVLRAIVFSSAGSGGAPVAAGAATLLVVAAMAAMIPGLRAARRDVMSRPKSD